MRSLPGAELNGRDSRSLPSDAIAEVAQKKCRGHEHPYRERVTENP